MQTTALLLALLAVATNALVLPRAANSTAAVSASDFGTCMSTFPCFDVC